MRSARRYIAVVQAPEGYPPRGAEPGEAPSPREPIVHSVVLAADYEALEVEVAHLRAIIGEAEAGEQAAADAAGVEPVLGSQTGPA